MPTSISDNGDKRPRLECTIRDEFSDTILPEWPKIHLTNGSPVSQVKMRLESAAQESYSIPSRTVDSLESLVRAADSHGKQLAALRDCATTLTRRWERVAKTREDVLLLRTRREYVSLTAVDQQRFVRESQEDFLKRAESMLYQAPTERSFVYLRRLHEQVLQDHERQMKHTENAQLLEAKLGEQEYLLQQKEHKLGQAAKQFMSLIENVHLPARSPTLSETESLEDAREEMPQLVRYYFDKVGEAGVLRERLVDLEYHHREARGIRMLQADQEQVLRTTDEEFEVAHQRERVKAEAALESALERVELAKKMCIGEDLDPELYRTRSASNAAWETDTSDPLHANEVGPAYSTNSLEMLEIQSSFRLQARPDLHLTALACIKDGQTDITPMDGRVQSWLENVAMAGSDAIHRSISRSRSEPFICENRDLTGTEPYLSRSRSSPNLPN